MINANLIREILSNELVRRGLFLVEITVSKANKIAVYIDSMQGVKLEECISVSRFLESKLNRDTEDFELEVSSPGLDRPLKLPVQYVKNTGRTVEVIKADGVKLSGKLTGVYDNYFILEVEDIQKDSKTGRKKKELKPLEIKFEEIKTTKVVLSLKK